MRVRRHLIGLKRLRGTTLNLLSEWAYDNFGHFVHECLGKWELFCLAGFDVAQVDHILIHRPLSANAQRLLACSGIPPSKIIWGDGVRGYRCERLLAPVAPGHRGTIDQSTGTALVQRYRPHTAQRTHKRLFIDRIGLQRQLTNIEEIRRLLMAAGYESYMPEQHPDTFIEDFAAAEAVVGIHGAGMGNALYCQPGTPVLEIQSSDHPNLAPMALVSCAGCKVGIIVADAGSTRRPGPTDPIQRSPLNPTLDLAEFSTAAAALNIPIAPR
jgi:capsular polysaccharide biosynthesis protein